MNRIKKEVKLKDVEIYSPRPGVVNLVEKDTKEYVTSIAFFCQDCFTVKTSILNYMVDTDLWHKHVPKNGILCLPCLEKRVGHKVEARMLHSTNYFNT